MTRNRNWKRHGKRGPGQAEVRTAGKVEAVDAWESVFRRIRAGGRTARTVEAEAAEE
jgi:hypothetical protein